MLSVDKLAGCLAGHVILLATNQPDEFSSDLFYNIYPLHVIDGYRRALEALGASVVTCTLSQALARLSILQDPAEFSVVNICVAFNALECEGVIQAVAALSNIPCFPCRGDIAVITEEKIVSKHLASASGFRVVESYHSLNELKSGTRYIRKYVNSGDSKGLRLVEDVDKEPPLTAREFVEPFVRGLDIELYCIFDPAQKKSILLNARVADWGDRDGADLIHSTEMKQSSDAYHQCSEPAFHWKRVHVAKDIEESVERLGFLLHNTFIFRIDGRLRPDSDTQMPIAADQFVFLEINALPTIPGDDGWYSPKLFEIAGVSDTRTLSEKQQNSADFALTLLLLIWHRHYVQSKSDDGNMPVL